MIEVWILLFIVRLIINRVRVWIMMFIYFFGDVFYIIFIIGVYVGVGGGGWKIV